MLRTIKRFTPKFLFNLYHLTLAWTGNVLYSHPSKKLYLIGVTGTKGKTTTSYLIYQFLQGNKYKSALTATTFFAIEGKFEQNTTKMGMPGRFFLPKFLHQAYRKGIKYAVVETTSEGILQHRQHFLDYNTVVFTSLSPEHIEHHGSFSAYREAKEKLFQQCGKTHIVNLNDKNASHFLKYPAKQKWGVILDGKMPKSFTGNYFLEGATADPNKLDIKEWELVNDKKVLAAQSEINMPFLGKFNATNLLLAFAAARSAGLAFEKLVTVIPKLVLPPGRMQELKNKSISFRIFLDYAHEPLSLKSAFGLCKDILPKNKKLICLTGAQGGGRDKWKRKVMGRIAADLCNYVVVGTEDPYQEDPNEINREVLEGVTSNKNFEENKNCWKFTDRKNAIQKALSLAEQGDIVILTGKGGENKMCIGDGSIPWDEEKEVKNAIENIKI